MLFGRARELGDLNALLSGAAAGRGGLRVVFGEAGIGKTRLGDEISARAAQRGFALAWGRAWETGGAPEYWPWIEVIGALVIPEVDLPPRVAGLLERTGSEASGEQTRADPERDRFELFDAVRGFLTERSRREPLLLVFDDLHVADVASLELLSFVARTLRASRIAVVGTYRDAESRVAPVAELLARISREGEPLALRPLSHEEVAEVVRHDIGHYDAGFAAAVFELTEGNPLFIREALHAVATRGLGSPIEALHEVAAMGGVLGLVRSRLAGADGEMQALLETMAVLGRDASLAILAEVSRRPPSQVQRLLEEAAARGLLVRRQPERWAFSHVLVREAFYRDLGPERRPAVHAAVCEALTRRVDEEGEEYLATLAHHALASLPAGNPLEAVRVARRAAARARSHLAYDEAVTLLESAMTACDTARLDDRERIEVELALGWACTEGGNLARGREMFRTAAQRARGMADPSMLARAALGQGGQYVLGETRGELVDVLREALSAIAQPSSTEERRLRARLLSRLSAALTPSEAPDEPLGLADEALAMTQDEVDPRVRIDVAVGAGSALMDHAPPEVRVPVNERLLADAREVGDRVLRLRALTRLCCDYLERGDIAAADAAIAARGSLADSLGQPRYRWETPLLRSMRAMPDGRFDDCEAGIREARQIAAQTQDPNSQRCVELHRFWMLLVSGRLEELRAQEARAIGALDAQLTDGAFRWISAVADARLGERAHARQAIEVIGPSPHVTARMSRATIAEAAVLCGAAPFAERLCQAFSSEEHATASWGPFAFVCSPPIARVLGMVAFAVGRADDGKRHCERALALTERMEAAGHRAWVHLAWGEGLSPAAAAREHLDRACTLGDRLGMPEVVRRASAAMKVCEEASPNRGARGAPQDTLRSPASFSLRRDGAEWDIEHAGRTFRLKDVRGLGMIATLVASPDVEVHSLDLASGRLGAAAIDTGDAGEVIDARARKAYAHRITELRAEIDQADRDADIGRAGRLRYELDALTDQLSAAVGVGGRVRRVGSAAERARITVQRRIREAIRKIAAQDEELGRHLDWAIRTGMFCAYEPRGRMRQRSRP